LTTKIQGYSTTTFDKKIKLKKDLDESIERIAKPECYYMEKAKEMTEELKGFEIIPPPEKKTVITKMRFKTKIKSDGEQYDNDRALMMKFHPELYEIKENKSIKMKNLLDVKKKMEILEQVKALHKDH